MNDKQYPAHEALVIEQSFSSTNLSRERVREILQEWLQFKANEEALLSTQARLVKMLTEAESLLGVDTRGQSACENVAELKSDIQQELRQHGNS